MIPTAFDQENCVLSAPPGMEESVVPLSCWRGPIKGEEALPCVISCWKPTKEEMAEIQRTGRIWLVILGSTMPPVNPQAFSPFEQTKE